MEPNQSKTLIKLLKFAFVYEGSLAVLTFFGLFALKLEDESLYFAVIGLHLPASIVVEPLVHMLQIKVHLPAILSHKILLVHIVSQVFNILILIISLGNYENREQFVRGMRLL